MVLPSSGFGGSKDSSFSWTRLPYVPFYQGSPLATPSLLMGQIPRVYGMGFTGVIDGNFSTIPISDEDLLHRPALCILEIMISIIVQNEIKR